MTNDTISQESLFKYEESLNRLSVALTAMDIAISEVQELDSIYYSCLDTALSQIDKRVTDVLHFVEFEELSDAEAIQEMRYLQRLERERRCLKRLSDAIRVIHTSGLCTNASSVNIGAIRKAATMLSTKEQSIYKLRDPDYFFASGNGCHAARRANSAFPVKSDEICGIDCTNLEFVQEEATTISFSLEEYLRGLETV